jgi:hypothetical protein
MQSLTVVLHCRHRRETDQPRRPRCVDSLYISYEAPKTLDAHICTVIFKKAQQNVLHHYSHGTMIDSK